MHGLIVDPYGQDNFLALPWLQVLTIEVEVLLGLWLLSRFHERLAWYVTLLFFIALAAISFTLASQGQASCGCFGKVEVNPWWTFALDAGIITVMTLLSVIPNRNQGLVSVEALAPHGPRAIALHPILQITLMTAGLLGLLALGFTLFTDDPWATLACLRGETLAVIPAVTQLGEGKAGEQRTFQVQLRNYSDKPIKVVGGTTSCACIATQDLPVTIPAGGIKAISVKINFSGTPGIFTHRFTLYSDSAERVTIARFTGSLHPGSSSVKTAMHTTPLISLCFMFPIWCS